MCARFTVLSDTPIAAAIAGCAIPLSRNSTIWMRWRCAAGIFHRSAVFSRRTSALLHLTIRSPESDGSSESHLKRGIQPVQPASLQIDPIHAVMEVVLEGANRANTIFFKMPPARVWVFSERITFYPSGVDPKGSGTTAYAWFVWDKEALPGRTELKWFKPGFKAKFAQLRHVHRNDVAR